MIQETIVTTQNQAGVVHIAPMGIHITADEFIILPFKPSTTLDNLLETNVAVLNYCTDVRVFAGCLTGRRDWPVKDAERITGKVLSCALAHTEVKVIHIEEDNLRPKLYCKSVHTVNHAPFTGFNRAQYAVLEAAILVSRLHRLPMEKIAAELAYLQIAVDKTAGDAEKEAWGWLMATVANYKAALIV
ncbi:DUF447 domain-containing protein [Crenothrix polyspora]|uniref:Tetrahydromethanopterin synthesis protein n=1 Tax=Crenothrix polyspora TaxID=360316 RepID=A0A1R4H1W8_9GAMM|nr:DUF447 domain-containing protein [Crenothrix polyspora]SJM89829.1 conserved hypothetical protein [Crenothrix polyspora]